MSDAATDDRPPDGERATFRRSDFILMRRAARLGWGVPDELKTESFFQAARIITGPDTSDRSRLAAMKFLLTAERTDVAAAALELAREKAEREKAPEADAAKVDLKAVREAVRARARSREV